MSGRRCASSLRGVSRRCVLSELADLDRAFHHASVERGIVVLQALERPCALDPALDPGDQHLEVERLEDHVVGAAS